MMTEQTIDERGQYPLARKKHLRAGDLTLPATDIIDANSAVAFD